MDATFDIVNESKNLDFKDINPEKSVKNVRFNNSVVVYSFEIDAYERRFKKGKIGNGILLKIARKVNKINHAIFHPLKINRSEITENREFCSAFSVKCTSSPPRIETPFTDNYQTSNLQCNQSNTFSSSNPEFQNPCNFSNTFSITNNATINSTCNTNGRNDHMQNSQSCNSINDFHSNIFQNSFISNVSGSILQCHA